jgi:catechol 2,3-dioxygenase-like lactoylglutathione lyase family enzyme
VARLDHLTLFVADRPRSRAWYTAALGLDVEFELDDARVTALVDAGGFTLFLQEDVARTPAPACVLYFQVDDVRRAESDLAEHGIALAHEPRSNDWGFGLEIVDPDGHVVRLWDRDTMDADADR